MNLGEYRKYIVNQHGLVDLVVDTVNYVDAGANLLINNAVRFIEEFDVVPMSVYAKLVTVGMDNLVLPPVKRVDRVTVRYSLLDTDDLIYAPDIMAWRDTTLTGAPCVYGFTRPLLVQPDQTNVSHADTGQWHDEVIYTDQTTFDERSQLMLFDRKFETAGSIRIEGQFYSKKLTSDSDKTIWFDRVDIMDQAILYLRDAGLRNRDGAQTGLAILDRLLSDYARRKRNFIKKPSIL